MTKLSFAFLTILVSGSAFANPVNCVVEVFDKNDEVVSSLHKVISFKGVPAFQEFTI